MRTNTNQCAGCGGSCKRRPLMTAHSPHHGARLAYCESHIRRGLRAKRLRDPERIFRKTSA